MEAILSFLQGCDSKEDIPFLNYHNFNRDLTIYTGMFRFQRYGGYYYIYYKYMF